MDYRTLFKEDNDRIRERYDLAVWRIEQILEEHSVCPPYDRFFEENARWILMCDRLLTALERDELESADPSVWPQIHDRLYETMYGSKMQDSWGNPDYAKRHLGNELGPYLSCLYGIIRSIIPAVWEYRRVPITVCMELFIEIYNDFEYEKVTAKMVRRAIYWFISDYADEFMTYKIRELTDSVWIDTSVFFGKPLTDKTKWFYILMVCLYRIRPFAGGADGEMRIRQKLKTGRRNA